MIRGFSIFQEGMLSHVSIFRQIQPDSPERRGVMSSASLRRRLVEFLIQSATELHLPPMVKYSALSLFAHRFLPSLSTSSPPSTHWLLSKPVRESNLQLFALISLWISSKSHGFRSLALPSLKTLADRLITDQIFTKADFLQGEIVFMRSLSFQIGTSMTAFPVLEELLFKFRAVAITGKLISFEACLEIMDLLYETEESSEAFQWPALLAASVLVSAYVITVPKQSSEFPVLPWVKFVTSFQEEEIILVVKHILQHILGDSRYA